MRDILPTIQQWTGNERPFVLARVVSTWGSAPRKVGSAMAVTSGNEFVGSVSGGCVEAAVIELATEVLDSKEPRLVEFGVDNEQAWSVGLSCGGQIKVLLEYFPSFSEDRTEREVGVTWLDLVQNGRAFVAISWFKDDDPRHCLVMPDGRIIGKPRAEAGKLVDAALSCHSRRKSELTRLGEQDVFIHAIRGKESLLIIGATDIAIHLVRLANHLEFETIVIDPRPVFAEAFRFDPKPDHIISAWPDEAFDGLAVSPDSYAVLLSHNPRIDDPALHRLLKSEVRYVGALGSKKTQDKRRRRLFEAGFTEEEVNRIKGPVGLDIGASSPAEIALSIMAEIVAIRNYRIVDEY